MTPPRPLGLVPRKLPFQPAIGSHTSMRMSEAADGLSVAVTRQNAGSALKGGTPRPPLYPRPRPAVLAVTRPGTSGTGPSVPASADEPPPSRGALPGTMNAPAFTTCADVIVVFGRESEPSRSQSAAGRGGCAIAIPGEKATITTSNQRMGAYYRRAGSGGLDSPAMTPMKRWLWWASWIPSGLGVFIILTSARWKLTRSPFYVAEWLRIGYADSTLFGVALVQV